MLPRPTQPSQSTAPVGRHHACGAGASPLSRAQNDRTGANRPARDVRRLVALAVQQRGILLRSGRGHMDAVECNRISGVLKQWLDRTNDYLSAESLRAFWLRHEMDLRFIMPATSGGKRNLSELQRLCA